MTSSARILARRQLANGFSPCRRCGSSLPHDDRSAIRIEPAHPFEPLTDEEQRDIAAGLAHPDAVLMLVRHVERFEAEHGPGGGLGVGFRRRQIALPFGGRAS